MARVHCPICGERHAADQCTRAPLLAPGTRLDDKYVVIRHLSTGGMGAVYEVEHTLIGKRLAAKVLLPELARKADILERFRREARAASAIGHEHIVEVTDFGESGSSAGSAPFIVMELLKGTTLGDEIARIKRLEPARAVRIARQMLSALSAAHARGIVHRDLKPDNIFLVPREHDDDFVKVLDFGISKFLDDTGEHELTRAGAIIGTPTYMAPEQAAGAPDVDHRVDLYATGAILYRMLTGVRPYQAPNFQQLVFLIMQGRLTPPRQKVPEIPPYVEAAVMKAMEVNPGDRYQSARQFSDALASDDERTSHFGNAETPARSLESPPVSQGEDRGWSQQSSTLQPRGQSEHKSPTRRLPPLNWILGGALLVLVTVALSFLIHRHYQRVRLEESLAADLPITRPTPTPVVTPALIHVGVMLDPADCTLTLDGAPIPRTGVDIARDGQRHVLHADATGYTAADLPFIASMDQTLSVALKKKGKRVRSLDPKLDKDDPDTKLMMQLVNGLKGELGTP